MSTLRLSLLATSLLVVTAAACAPSDVPPAQNSEISKKPSSSGDPTSSGGSTTGTGSSGGTTATGSSSGDPTKPTDGSDGSGPCGPLIGKWTATFDDGAEATGDDIPIGSVGFSGKMDFSLTHDDADVKNVVDFVGTATIEAMGQTQTYQMSPATNTTGDTKDTTCAGGLHIKGVSNVDPIGNVVFTMDGDFDDTASPPSKGHASFTMKTSDDDGKAMTGKGTAHIVRQQ